MVVAEDILSYFQSSKSYERISTMCRLLNCFMPWELRFIGACLEEHCRRDYEELRPNEIKANNATDILHLREVGNIEVQRKIILFLTLLHSRNYTCSGSFYKILSDFDVKLENISDDESFEQLITMYTLAVNHPAFTYDQKKNLRETYNVICEEEKRRSNLKVNPTKSNQEPEMVPFNGPIPVQESSQMNVTENIYTPPAHFPTSHLTSVPPPYHEIPMLAEQNNMGIPASFYGSYYRGAWTPIVFNTTEPPASTQSTFVSRPSSPSISNSPSRPSSPSNKTRPISAAFTRSQLPIVPLPQPPTQPQGTLHLPQTNDDQFNEIISKPITSSNDLNRMTDDQLTAIGMVPDSIQRIRCMHIPDKRMDNDGSVLPTTLSDINETEIAPNYAPAKSLHISTVPPLMYHQPPSMVTVGMELNQPPGYTTSPHCAICINADNVPVTPINGFVSPTTVPCEMVPGNLENNLGMLQLEPDENIRNTNGCNSDSSSSGHPSPPNTPSLSHNHANSNKRNKAVGTNDWNNGNFGSNINNNTNCVDNKIVNTSSNHICNSNVGGNVNNDERSNNGDSSGEERNYAHSNTFHWGGQINTRGRSKNQSTFSRGRGGSNRRRVESLNGASDEARKQGVTTNYASNSAVNTNNVEIPNTTFHYTNQSHTNPAPISATIYPQFIRFHAPYPTHTGSGYPVRTHPHHHNPYQNGEMLFPHYPPPAPLYATGPLHYPMMVQPKNPSCYNCGNHGHGADECTETTLEEASKSSHFRLDYSPVDTTFAEK